jgi:hypothetical protein
MADVNPAPTRTITHNQRLKSADVNPLLQSSSQPITSAEDNFVVGRQAGAQLHNIVPGFKLPFKERFFNAIEKYYEVDKRSYPFVVAFQNMPSAQATFKFNVTVEFNLKVIDPCVIVRDNATSMLDCILLDLKRCVHDVTSRFLVQNTDETRMALQTALNSFRCPAYLQMVCGVVDIMPDEAATKMLRELEEKNLKVAIIGTRTEVVSAQNLGDKIASSVADNLEEHQLQKQIPGLVQKVLNG